ncbi:methionine aminotransferase [Pedobacter sp. MW01-1-1]|uniref:methionine aminotransferase n=1 Tax=Pedobacter sp. MW01-1-1 TaxID=3383027 RepID=UPI003FEDFAE4
MINIQSKLPHVGTTIFSVMSKLAQDYHAINLSQGFPDYPADPELIELVNRAMIDGYNQYAPMEGDSSLKEAIAAKIEKLHKVSIQPDTQITITAGATQAIFTAMAAVIQPGDEVVVIEPAYDSYAPTIKLLGGLVKTYDAVPPNYEIDWDVMKKLITAHTKMIVLNTPHNPTGSILSDDDMKMLCKITAGTDILILSDEVYEHLIYDGEIHRSVLRYPELAERSFVVASFGKLLHTTGWKLGYCVAAPILTKEFRKVHQFNVFSVNSSMQKAIAPYLENANNYLNLASFFQEKRDLFSKLMTGSRFNFLPCKGSYFQCVSYQNISTEKDKDFCTRLIKEYGVAAIPVSAFYQKPADHHIIRFCFAKADETLRLAAEKLKTI